MTDVGKAYDELFSSRHPAIRVGFRDYVYPLTIRPGGKFSKTQTVVPDSYGEPPLSTRTSHFRSRLSAASKSSPSSEGPHMRLRSHTSKEGTSQTIRSHLLSCRRKRRVSTEPRLGAGDAYSGSVDGTLFMPSVDRMLTVPKSTMSPRERTFARQRTPLGMDDVVSDWTAFLTSISSAVSRTQASRRHPPHSRISRP